MTGLWIFLGGVALVLALTFWHASGIARRRRRLRSTELSGRERALVAKRFPLWERLPGSTRRAAEGWMRVFLSEKGFEACGGLEEVTEEMRLAVAAPACLLIAHRPQDYYERLRSVLVYPDAFHAGDHDVRLGESWSTGSVVLSWQSICQGSANPEDGLNVVLHEFAHQIDQEDGVADGVPEFDEGPDYGRWSSTLAPAYERFCEDVEAGKRTVLDAYGAESPAEFFAVATETFFEKPRQLRDDERDGYREVSRGYGMDAAGRRRARGCMRRKDRRCSAPVAHWYYGENGEQRGPVEDHELRGLIATGRVNATTIIWREGMENWKPMSEVPEWSAQIVSPQAGSPYQTPAAGSYSPYPVVPNNGNAIASLVCGISSVLLMFTCFVGILAGIPAVICGHLALRQINESAVPMAGRGMAIAGLVTGYITIGLTVCFGVFMGIAIASDM